MDLKTIRCAEGGTPCSTPGVLRVPLWTLRPSAALRFARTTVQPSLMDKWSAVALAYCGCSAPLAAVPTATARGREGVPPRVLSVCERWCPSQQLSGGARSSAAYSIHRPAMQFDSIRSIGPVCTWALLTSGYKYQREYRVSTDDGLRATYEPKGRQPSQRTVSRTAVLT